MFIETSLRRSPSTPPWSSMTRVMRRTSSSDRQNLTTDAPPLAWISPITRFASLTRSGSQTSGRERAIRSAVPG